MTRHRLNKVLGVFTTLIGGCTASGSRGPTIPAPVPAETDTGSAEDFGELRFSAGSFHYHLREKTKVQAEGSADTASSAITTTALLSVEVTPYGDSDYNVVVSIDSLKISTEGLIPSRSVTGISSLGPILQASFRGNTTTVNSYLPDSLCAYSQFIMAARRILLPRVPVRIGTLPPEVWVDTATITSCRAGSRIKILTTQEIKPLGREPHKFALHETTELTGAGILHRNSVEVSGSIRTLGSISFPGRSRLPSLVETESDGSITIRLGNSTIVFRQSSTQHIEQDTARLPN